VDECTAQTHNCAAGVAKCTDTVGSFTCACNVGYTGTGVACADNNECTLNTHNCAALALCINGQGSFTCACKAGYTGSGLSCAEVNECALNTHNCAIGAACTNMIGSFTCACNLGYAGGGVVCTDNNECTLNTHTCPANAASCTNTPGSFACACNGGFVGSGTFCARLSGTGSSAAPAIWSTRSGGASATVHNVNLAGSWSGFMNSYAVWPTADGVSPCDTNLVVQWTVAVPKSQSCLLSLQVDNSGSVAINGVTVASSTNFSPGGATTVDVFTGSATTVTISVTMLNYGPNWGSPCSSGNPAGAAALLQC
jgi:hypothetical protein